MTPVPVLLEPGTYCITAADWRELVSGRLPWTEVPRVATVVARTETHRCPDQRHSEATGPPTNDYGHAGNTPSTQEPPSAPAATCRSHLTALGT
jgi:hypothetical protein